MGRTILFVDDERAILRSLERLFIDSDYEIIVAESGADGLKLLAEQPVDVVVSDMRMPTMDGHHFLRLVKELYPGTSRLILSGYAVEKDIIDSLIDGSISFYLFKPWNGEELIQKLDQVFAARDLFRSPELLAMVNRMDNLSVLTGIYNAVARLIAEDAEITAIARVIGTDPAVTAAVLRVVNSAFYNIRTASVGQAITFLGLPVIKAVVLSCSLYEAASLNIPPFTKARLAGHASLSNRLLNHIYHDWLGKPLPDNLATAGLLHNIGLVMGLHYLPRQYREIIEQYMRQQGRLDVLAAEKQAIGITHTEMGGYFLDCWSMPYATVECALFHESPLHPAVLDKKAVAAVHLAGHFAWQRLAPELASPLENEVYPVLGIDKQQFESAMRHSDSILSRK